MQTLAVVIPFFQRDASLLRRCVGSILAQTIGPDWRLLIVVVDDASPTPLNAALEGVVVPSPHELVCLARANGGPGAARNTGLDYLNAQSVDFVAFIDSDDTWREGHVARALTVLAEDADFFFCDHDRWDYPDSYLAGSERFQGWLASPAPPFFAAAASGGPVYQFGPGEAFRCFLQDYLAQTSTVVYRWRRFATLRFDAALRYAGEDNMFWLHLAKSARAVRFTTARDVETGEGVNMWAGSIGWWHPEAARRLAAVIQYHWAIRRTFALDRAERAFVNRGLAHYEAELAQVLVRKFVKAPTAAAKVLLSLLERKPSLALVLPVRLFQRPA